MHGTAIHRLQIVYGEVKECMNGDSSFTAIHCGTHHHYLLIFHPLIKLINFVLLNTIGLVWKNLLLNTLFITRLVSVSFLIFPILIHFRGYHLLKGTIISQHGMLPFHRWEKLSPCSIDGSSNMKKIPVEHIENLQKTPSIQTFVSI